MCLLHRGSQRSASLGLRGKSRDLSPAFCFVLVCNAMRKLVLVVTLALVASCATLTHSNELARLDAGLRCVQADPRLRLIYTDPQAVLTWVEDKFSRKPVIMKALETADLAALAVVKEDYLDEQDVWGRVHACLQASRVGVPSLLPN